MLDSTLAVAQPSTGDESWTRREILQQPATLRATQAILDARRDEIDAFMRPLLDQRGLRIMLCGAGTSAFIGECLAPWLSATLGRPVEAVATTDIVSAPHLYLDAGRPTLMVSFGRSGNSPESVAAVDLADARIASVHHLVITCNAQGALSRRQPGNTFVVLLPEETHDRAFAMTSSFSAMMLSALSIFTGAGTMPARVEAIANAVEAMLGRSDHAAETLAGADFERVVYLGSGVFQGLAREAALKLLELTDGAIPTAFDSSLGFRHGPKTIVTPRTLVVVFVSNDPLTRLYDLDIIEELRADGRCGAVIVIAAREAAGETLLVEHAADLVDADLLFPYITFAQLYGLHCSLRLGRTPDQPNANGTVNRVVQGVRIHTPAA
ncbi:SIS domain-containing protein [Sphingomonas sp. H39-1-10]|uniref:SIS domain-containing protein n=1 Tax=Sphingomonas TaxID=13687 RepID=UPI00087F44E8|nr:MULTISPECIES: SIS domain-containing protein [Sphingomonas]MDF0488933.1 SIS domain-containing protein [Sphingomonas pollutisoli]SDA20190.1 tagatose-6-phosphate ketose/aldose isomerase [Sphingomonas sp. NFR15]